VGVAAYQRGSALISRQIRREFGFTVYEDRPAAPSKPRPASWGDATKVRALESARGFVRYERSRGREPSVGDVIGFLSSGGAVPATCGVATAEAIAQEVCDGM